MWDSGKWVWIWSWCFLLFCYATLIVHTGHADERYSPKVQFPSSFFFSLKCIQFIQNMKQLSFQIKVCQRQCAGTQVTLSRSHRKLQHRLKQVHNYTQSHWKVLSSSSLVTRQSQLASPISEWADSSASVCSSTIFAASCLNATYRSQE